MGFLPEKDKIGIGKIVSFADAKRETCDNRKESIVAKRSDDEKKLLDEVLPNVAAQMRAPLSILHASLQKMIGDSTPLAAQLNQSYHQLLRLAANLSAAEWLADGDCFAELQNGDLVAFCRALSERIAPLAAAQQITWNFECTLRSHIMAYDERLLERMVLNLVSNALKFTPPGGEITLSLRRGKQDVLLSVADTGCGIAEEQLRTLFDRYLHSECMDPAPHGLGLGLPLCNAIAQAHGGRIFAQSQVGVGTKITVALPDRQSMIHQVEEGAFDYTGGFDHVLVELSDALHADAYEWKKSR